MYFVCLLLLCGGFAVPSFASLSLLSKISSDYYYWATWNRGVIPEDAVPVGNYLIGRTAKNNDIIVGRMSRYANTLRYVYNLACEEASGKIEVLCTKYPDRIYWNEVNHESAMLRSNHHLIMGGFVNNHPILIGRDFSWTNVGSVLLHKQPLRGMYFAEFNLGNYRVNWNAHFMVLAFNDTCCQDGVCPR